MSKVTGVAVAVLVAVVALAGGAAAEGISVTFFPLDPNPRENMAPALQAFTAQTGIRITDFQVVPWAGGQERIVSALAAGRGSDVIYTTTGRALQLVDLGAVAPLDRRLTPEFVRSVYKNPGIVEQFRWKGQLYLAPFVRNAHVWVVNRQAFRRAGVSTAVVDRMADPRQSWSWDELLDLARRLTVDLNGDGKPDQWGYAYPGGDQRASPFLRLYWNFERDVVTPDGRVVIGGPETVQLLELLAAMAREGLMPPGVESMNARETEDLFSSGRVAMIQTDLLGPVQDAVASGDFEIVYPPVAPNGGRGNFVAFDSLVINSSSRNPEAAWKFIEFVLTSDAFRNYLLGRHLAPASGVDPTLEENPVFRRKFEVENRLVADFWTRHEAFHPAGPAIIAAYNAAAQAVLSGRKNPQQAAADLRAEVERAVQSVR
mgnify:CR=1 FL=1